MLRKLYYTTQLDGTYNKRITCYDMINNEPKIFCEIETDYASNIDEEIQTYLDNNGYEDEEFEFINL